MTSLRALKKENADLRRRVAVARKTGQVSSLNTWKVSGIQRVQDQVTTARMLGFDVEIRFNAAGEMVLTAFSRVQA